MKKHSIKKMTKCLCVSAAMAVASICSSAMSVSAAPTTVKIGSITYTLYDDYAEVTACEGMFSTYFFDEDTIESTVYGLPVAVIGGSAFRMNVAMKSADIPEGIVLIRNGGAFMGCSNLESVTLPNTLEVIGRNTFLSCDSLKEITLPASVDAVGDGAFRGAESLKSVTILNPECVIEDEDGKGSTICNTYIYGQNITFTGTIYGYTNSTAQAYAEKYGYNFVALDAAETTTTTLITTTTSTEITNADSTATSSTSATAGSGESVITTTTTTAAATTTTTTTTTTAGATTTTTAGASNTGDSGTAIFMTVLLTAAGTAYVCRRKKD